MNDAVTSQRTSRLPVMLPVLCAVIIALADQVTKRLIIERITLGDAIPVIPGFFNLTLTYNYGAAFGMFSGMPDGVRQIVLAVATVGALGVVILLWRKFQSIPALVSLGLVLGGAIGNIIDRVRFGFVIDFLDVHVGEWHWPAFNVADSAICIGVAVLVFCKPSIDEPAPAPHSTTN